MHMNKALHALSQQLFGYKIITAAFHSLASPRPNFRALVAAALDESNDELRDKWLQKHQINTKKRYVCWG